MRRGTTPTIAIKVHGCDLSKFETIYVTFGQGTNLVDKTGEDLEIEGDTVSVFLTQEDTLLFDSRKRTVEVQIRAVSEGGVAVASNIRQIPVDAILKEGVI